MAAKTQLPALPRYFLGFKYTEPEGQGIRVSLLSRAGVGSSIHVNIPETPPVWLAMPVPVIKRETDVGAALEEQTVLEMEKTQELRSMMPHG